VPDASDDERGIEGGFQDFSRHFWEDKEIPWISEDHFESQKKMAA
jgi:hypothetical protein